MDINYFLLLQKKYDEMIENINSIIDTCDDIGVLTDEFVLPQDKSLCTIFNSQVDKDFFIEKKKHILHLKNICKQYIQNACCHEFVEDFIDITPDKSQPVTYCKLCEYCPSSLSNFEHIYTKRG